MRPAFTAIHGAVRRGPTTSSMPDSVRSTVLEPAGAASPATLRATLARNLAALARRRPEAHAAILAAPPLTPAFEVAQVTGGLTIAHRRPDGSLTPLGPGSAEAVATMPEATRHALAGGAAKALNGIGDGAILEWIARNPPRMLLDAESVVYIIEPDAALAAASLMLRDFSGPAGPIAQRRFRWYIGPAWREQAAQELLDEPMLVHPGCLIAQSPHAAVIAAFWDEIGSQRTRAHAQRCAEATAHYGGLDAAQLARRIAGSSPHPPRVLFIASRLTTVLQHSCRDAADAFTSLGWQTHLVIEREKHHVLNEQAVMKAIVAFKPDLVFNIDHLRAEHAGMPADVPFVCWIQDNLPNLTSGAAAASINRREFVCGAWVNVYAAQHHYPERQCIIIPRLTRARDANVQQAARSRPLADDLVYVSNHSVSPEAILERLASAAGAPRPLVEESGRRIIQCYERGQCLRQQREVHEIVASVRDESAAAIAEPELARIALDLYEVLNNALYRQQALRWAIRAAASRGLTLGIHGRGWQENPEFAPHARGFIEYGRPLDELTLAARFNLQLEPFSPTMHQRLLDGLMAGGFFLSRLLDPHAALRQDWIALMDATDPPLRSMRQARERLAGEPLATIEALHARMQAAYKPVDWVHQYRLQPGSEHGFMFRLPPRYLDIAFIDEPGLAALIDRYMDDEPLRCEIAAEQRAFVKRHFTYDAGMKRLATRIGELIAEEARQSP
jgi:hypothetical protein